MKKSAGMTLLELMVAVALIAIVATLGIPNFQSMIANNRLTAAANALTGAFQFARAEAVRRGEPVIITAQGATVGNEWSDGARIWFDTNGDGDYDDGEELRFLDRFSGSLSIGSGGQTSISFNGAGEPNAVMSLTVCDGRTGETGVQIDILGSGTARSRDLACG